jgi:hypothetical protein
VPKAGEEEGMGLSTIKGFSGRLDVAIVSF